MPESVIKQGPQQACRTCLNMSLQAEELPHSDPEWTIVWVRTIYFSLFVINEMTLPKFKIESKKQWGYLEGPLEVLQKNQNTRNQALHLEPVAKSIMPQSD
jgi:hypothetical protein